jgi:amidase
MPHQFTRRAFLGTTAAGGAAMFATHLDPLLKRAVSAASAMEFNEATIPQLQAVMAGGELTSRELTMIYLNRIAALNPTLHAVIETNPQAIAIAAQLDNERRRGVLRGPLHGIPVLVKDNIATDDNMQTTAGSLALENSVVSDDATLVKQLRKAGAVILGKANLGEWANFRGFNPFKFYGWSARGGATQNPYDLSQTAWGSSSGSAVAVAANLCSVSVGTETDGSIVGPANVNLVVGLKPTLGLIAQDGIIPIALSQDTAGPMGRTVTDVAILLDVLKSPFGQVAEQPLPATYTTFLRRGALRGARIGVDRRYFDHYDIYGFPGEEDNLPLAQQALQAMVALGATLVDTDTGDFFELFEDEFTTLLYEFKVQIADYLATLRHSRMRTLADLIEFNRANCAQEMVYYGQELFEMSEATSGDLGDPIYQLARRRAHETARRGIDEAIAAHNLDAVVAPHLTNSPGPAVSGYPNLSLPIGLTASGKPAGLLMYSTFLREPQLLGFAYDLEQELNARREPRLLGEVVLPPQATICGPLPKQQQAFNGKRRLPQRAIF